MSKVKQNKQLASIGGQNRLDISVNVSHNKTLSKERLIHLVKLLARQAAEDDYAKITKTKPGW